MSASDQELLERWVARQDAEAFKDLSKRHAAMVYATCRRILGNDADAEDMAQECFVALMHAGRKPGSYLGPWLHLVATRRSLNWLRGESRRRRREMALAESAAAAEIDTDREILALVDAAIAKLPEKQRQALVAYFFEDQTQEAIAETLGLTRQAVAYRIQTGVEAIRASMGAAGVTASAAALTTLLSREAAAAAPAGLAANLGRLAIHGHGAAPAALAKPTLVFMAAGGKAKGAAAIALLLPVIGAILFSWLQPPPGSGIQMASPPDNQDRAVDASANTDGPVEDTGASDSQVRELIEASTPNSSGDPDAVATGGGPVAKRTEDENASEPDPGQAGISGYVLDKGAFPVPGATVSLVTGPIVDVIDPRAWPASRTTTTDGSGFYSLERLTPGLNFLSATALGFQTSARTVTLEPGGARDDLDFVLEKGVALNGIVLAQDGKPVEGALVAPLGAASNGSHGSGGQYYQQIVSTDSTGAFSIGFEDVGLAALKVAATGHGTGVFSEVPVGSERPVELRLGPAASLSGTIAREDGSAAADVEVVLNGAFAMAWARNDGKIADVSGKADSQKMRTSNEGRYGFATLASGVEYRVQIQTGDHKALSFEYGLGEFGPGETKIWNHTLQPMIRVFGTVVGEQSGRPVTNVRVSYMLQGEYVEGAHLGGGNAYELRLFDPGIYTIFPNLGIRPARADADLYGVEVSLTTGEERELNFTMPDPFELSVRVVDLEGVAIEGATANWLRILPSGTASTHGSGRTDSEGRYAHHFLAGMESWFHVTKEGYTAVDTTRVQGEPGVQYPEETVTLYQRGGVEGQLVDGEGMPIADTTLLIALRLPTGNAARSNLFTASDSISTSTDAEGNFAVGEDLPATTGRVHLWIRDESDELREHIVDHEVTILPGRVTHLGTIVYAP